MLHSPPLLPSNMPIVPPLYTPLYTREPVAWGYTLRPVPRHHVSPPRTGAQGRHLDRTTASKAQACVIIVLSRNTPSKSNPRRPTINLDHTMEAPLCRGDSPASRIWGATAWPVSRGAVDAGGLWGAQGTIRHFHLRCPHVAPHQPQGRRAMHAECAFGTISHLCPSAEASCHPRSSHVTEIPGQRVADED